jgi:enamine deaminase RidA (YjgF/YER057c/UK114 family)
MPTETQSLAAFEQTLPPVTQPLGSYVTCVQVGDLIFTSGALPMKDGVVAYTGSVGNFVVPLEVGQEAAKLCCINLLSILKDKLTTLHRVQQVVKLTGYVNSGPLFTQHPQVINAASDMLAEVFGEKGRHARTSIGVASLPLDAAVELDLIVQVSP